ncbi:ComEA family DNA-binding protein [Streptomyces zagrosensis]|uniref:Competence protein ComEA n=1 Tax=Streptomyces zagrosensis TaxID=1042984 RepID=A0A7W9UWT9_9ACTN|nr:ComEA family DNA-binding protein [Streptomyces zagrosensis]MBB5933014.1 competence protein ComEA [Streptomyces zagrosensis]
MGAGAGRVVVVDVTGKVREPGVRRLPAGARVADALKAAGGVEPGARTSELNRARVLTDGEHIVVGAPPGAAGAAAGSAPNNGGAASFGASGPGTPTGAGAGSAAGSAAAPGPAISLSSATVEQLDTLPGVGPVLARHILDYRTQHGGFRSVEELREVNGIGDKRFADLRPLVQP